MSVFWLYLLPPLAFAGVMFLLFKLLEAAGATSASDFEIEPRPIEGDGTRPLPGR
ncbi:MAG TPA: hypothetical protein VKD43_07780 [Xanthobacteraceae bacterium]|nr:hypothetical protein [Xanthobacteraceae bacterium]